MSMHLLHGPTIPKMLGSFQLSDCINDRGLPRRLAVPYDPEMAGKQRAAQEAWRAIFDFIVATSAERNAALGRADLTPNDARTLASIAPNAQGRSMRSLADEWRCDASTVTWMVDRLEARGLAERRPHPSGRRLAFRSSSTVEQRAVNATVPGSNPGSGANLPDHPPAAA